MNDKVTDVPFQEMVDFNPAAIANEPTTNEAPGDLETQIKNLVGARVNHGDELSRVVGLVIRHKRLIEGMSTKTLAEELNEFLDSKRLHPLKDHDLDNLENGLIEKYGFDYTNMADVFRCMSFLGIDPATMASWLDYYIALASQKKVAANGE